MKTIQERLKEIDYNFDNYKPSLNALMFIEFIKKVNENNGGLENKTPLFHYKIADLLFDTYSKNKAIMCFRGASKTGLFEYMVLYGMCFNKMLGMSDIHVGMYIANNMKDGAKQFRNSLEQKIRNSEFLQEMIPTNKIKLSVNNSKVKYSLDDSGEIDNEIGQGMNFTDMSLDVVNKNNQPFYLKLFGISTGVRGFKAYDRRPSFCILDDLLKDADARSETVIKGLEEVIYRAVPYALHPSKRVICWAGTPFNSKDPLYKALESKSWKSVIFPIAEKFPCSKEEFKGAWEDRFPYEALQEQWDLALKSGQEQGFRQEMMLQIIPEEGLLVPPEKIIEIPSSTFAEKNKELYNFYITTDFAYTDRESSDYSVISIWAVNSNKEYILVDGFCGKQLMDKNLDLLFTYVQQYNPLQVGFELTGQQVGFVNIIRNEMMKKNIFFNLKEIRPSKDKFSRFNLISPFFHKEKIMILSHMMKTTWGIEFSDEISKATIEGFKSKHDDVLDTLSQLMDLDIFAPSGYYSEDYDSKKDYNTKSNLIF